jgi:LCP family protein required for cell wall assembly
MTGAVVPSPTAPSAATATPADDRYAFLLLGYGGGGHDGAYLTDSMMVVIVDPSQKTLTLLSIPRDSWVPFSFDGTTWIYNKINTAYAFAQDPSSYPNRLDRYKGPTGPGTFASDTVSHLLGIPIRYYLALDFEGFRQMIDAVGGVDVNVPDSFAANYPANDDPSVNPGWTVVRFTKGTEHMNGERAIEFARARESIDNPSEGSDFARSNRQRIIMQAFKARLFQFGGLIHLPQLLAIAAKHVDTNYTIPDVASLSQLVVGWQDVRFFQTALTTANYLEDATGPYGAYIAVPNSPDHSWAQIQAFTRRLWNDPTVLQHGADSTALIPAGPANPAVPKSVAGVVHFGQWYSS